MPAQSGMSGSEPISLSIVHLIALEVARRARPDLRLRLDARVREGGERIGEAPPPSVQTRAMTSFEQAHCMKSQAASWFFE